MSDTGHKVKTFDCPENPDVGRPGRNESAFQMTPSDRLTRSGDVLKKGWRNFLKKEAIGNDVA